MKRTNELVFTFKLDKTKRVLSTLLDNVKEMKQNCNTDEERKFVEDLYCAIDNAIDIASTKRF